MIEVPILNVLYKKDVYTTTSMQLPPQDVAVLSMFRGRENVTIVGPTGKTREYDPDADYSRLVRAYGIDKKRGISYAERAFGEPHLGKMAETMHNAAQQYGVEKPPKKAAPRKKAVKESGENAAAA